MAEGVAEVEDHAQAGFALIGGHDIGFDLNGFSDDVDEVLWFPFSDRCFILFQIKE